MSYTKHNFKKGDILTADQMNAIEAGIVANETAIANKQDKGDYVTNATLNTNLSKKQDKLVSGTNLKTVNGQSLLGSGNISIEGTEGATSISQAINYDLNVKAINHRGYSAEAPENTIPAYIMSKQKGFTYVECDVSFTSDGVAVLLHDATIDRTSNGTGSISGMTYAKALTYDFGSWFSSEYEGVKIPTFTEFMMTCKGLGLHPYIELKSNGSYTQAQITQIVDEVEACGMKGKVTYISFNNTFLSYVKNADKSARLGLLANPLNSTKISQAVALQADTNEVFMDAKLSTLTTSLVQSCIDKGLPLEVWTVNTESEIINMSNYISGVTSDNLVAGKILYERYLCYTPPEGDYIPATSISLDQTSLAFSTRDAQTLTATVEPSNASDPVVWTSDNINVAKVEDGVVTPIAKGDCTITAAVGELSATCEVAVAFEVKTFTITRTLTNCSSSSEQTVVAEGSAYTETFSVEANSGYSLDSGTVYVTMGGEDISNSVVNGVLTIEYVTGDIEIVIEAGIVQPVVDLALANVIDGVIVNNGTGGATYDTTVKNGSYTSDNNGISLLTAAYVDTPYGFSKSKPFTICVKGSFDAYNETSAYQRMFRSDQDMPSVYLRNSDNRICVKLTGKSGGMTNYSDIGEVISNQNNYQFTYDVIGADMHTYTWVFNVDDGAVYFYLDGELCVKQTNVSNIVTSTSCSIGDSGQQSYHADKITVSKFVIYDCALPEALVSAL